MNIQIEVNGAPLQCEEGSTVAKILVDLNLAESFVAVAVNRTCIPKSNWGNCSLTNGDSIEVLAPMAGG